MEETHLSLSYRPFDAIIKGVIGQKLMTLRLPERSSFVILLNAIIGHEVRGQKDQYENVFVFGSMLYMDTYINTNLPSHVHPYLGYIQCDN